MNEPRTLREVLNAAWPVYPPGRPGTVNEVRAGTAENIWQRLEHTCLLDAPLIGFPCEDGQPRYAIVDPKAWEAARAALTRRVRPFMKKRLDESWLEGWADEAMQAIARALIPGLRRAKEVGIFHMDEPDNEDELDAPVVVIRDETHTEGRTRELWMLNDGDAVAILDEEDA